MKETIGKLYLKELESEAPATKACLERVPLEKLYDWKPHEKSMKMGDLAVMIAEIPRWITTMIEKGDIDFGTFSHNKVRTKAELVSTFEKNMADAKKALSKVSDEELEKPFSLKNKGVVLFTSPKDGNISGSINHLVHHRGQLTVYMRLNNIPVPKIYGPSADEKGF